MILKDGNSSLSIELSGWDGDAIVVAAVESQGFSGRADLHVAAQEFRRFCAALVRLAKALNGHAQIISAMPGELEINIGPSNGRGYFAVSGHIGDSRSPFWHAVHFGFEVEYAQIERLSKQE